MGIGTSQIKYAVRSLQVGDQPLLRVLSWEGHDKDYFGAWPQQIAGTPEGWMTYYHGMVDELRIYKRLCPHTE